MNLIKCRLVKSFTCTFTNRPFSLVFIISWYNRATRTGTINDWQFRLILLVYDNDANIDSFAVDVSSSHLRGVGVSFVEQTLDLRFSTPICELRIE